MTEVPAKIPSVPYPISPHATSGSSTSTPFINVGWNVIQEGCAYLSHSGSTTWEDWTTLRKRIASTIKWYVAASGVAVAATPLVFYTVKWVLRCHRERVVQRAAYFYPPETSLIYTDDIGGFGDESYVGTTNRLCTTPNPTRRNHKGFLIHPCAVVQGNARYGTMGCANSHHNTFSFTRDAAGVSAVNPPSWWSKHIMSQKAHLSILLRIVLQSERASDIQFAERCAWSVMQIFMQCAGTFLLNRLILGISTNVAVFGICVLLNKCAALIDANRSSVEGLRSVVQGQNSIVILLRKCLQRLINVLVTDTVMVRVSIIPAGELRSAYALYDFGVSALNPLEYKWAWVARLNEVIRYMFYPNTPMNDKWRDPIAADKQWRSLTPTGIFLLVLISRVSRSLNSIISSVGDMTLCHIPRTPCYSRESERIPSASSCSTSVIAREKSFPTDYTTTTPTGNRYESRRNTITGKFTHSTPPRPDLHTQQKIDTSSTIHCHSHPSPSTMARDKSITSHRLKRSWSRTAMIATKALVQDLVISSGCFLAAIIVNNQSHQQPSHNSYTYLKSLCHTLDGCGGPYCVLLCFTHYAHTLITAIHLVKRCFK